MAVLAPPQLLDQDPTSRKLSEVTKHLWYPKERIAGSHWPEVREICVGRMGLEFDRWQSGMCDLALSYDDQGFLVHTVGGFGMSLPRQVGKTSTLAGLIFGLCVHIPGLLVIWSAHHSVTHEETFLSMQGFAERELIKPFIAKVYTGSGDEEVRFWNGSRILFGARERGFGRGIPGVDILINDEGQILSQKAMQNMLATMNTSQFALHVYAGTPPKPGDMSETFTSMRNDALAALAGDIARLDDMVWIECGASDHPDLDSMDEAAAANPSFPHRTPIQAFWRLRRRLDDEGYRREALGVWDPSAESVFDLTAWNDLGRPASTVAAPESACMVIDVSPDRRFSCLGIVGENVDGETVAMVHTLRGVTRTVAEIVKLRDERSIIDIAITSGAARALETELNDEAIEYERMGTTDMAAAYANLQKAIVTPGSFVHLEQPELNYAIEMTRSRSLGTGEAEAFDRRGYSVDISPAVAVAGALYRWGTSVDAMPLIM